MRILGSAVRLLALSMVLVVAGRAQQQQQPSSHQPPPPGAPAIGSAVPDGAEVPRDIQEKQALARNTDRQKRLVADTDKLLALATELHDEVAKTDKNILSLEVIRKAEEIEKLSKSIKERMKG